MRILVVGASGVLGRALIPHLAGHQVVGTTRTPARRATIEAAGASAVVCDVYDPGALERVARDAAPEIVVNLLTDLSHLSPGTLKGFPNPPAMVRGEQSSPAPHATSRQANARIRREGGPVVVGAARAAGARRLIVESVAFTLTGEGASALAALEDGAHASGLEAVIIRFGRLWGPGTWSESAPAAAPTVHVSEAGRRAAPLVVAAPPGRYDVVD